LKNNPQAEARVASSAGSSSGFLDCPFNDETRLVAHGQTYQNVVDQLDRIGDVTSIILKAPPSWLPLAV
jgi:hypothetical protein